MKFSKIIDIKTKSDLREYFVLTSVLGVGMFLTILLFSLSFFYQIRTHQKNLDLRSMRIQEFIQQTLNRHNLGLKYIEKRIGHKVKSHREPLLPMVDDFVNESLFEAIDVVNIDWMRDRENPQLMLVNSDARDPDKRGLIFENFLKKLNQYKIPLYRSGKYHSFVFNPGDNKSWYVGQIRYIEGRKTEMIMGWIPIQKIFPNMATRDQPLSITLTNFLYPQMPSVQMEYRPKEIRLTKLDAVDNFSRSNFSFAQHRLLDEDRSASNITANYIYAGGENYGWSWIVLVAGLSISILVSLLFFNLINRNIEVQRLVEEKTQDVIIASREAMKANEVKTRFLANISHEIRTPLNIILGMAELLGDTKLSMDQRKYVETFKKSGVHLLDLINDVIDMIRLEGDEGIFENKDFSVSEVVQEVSNFCAVTSQSKALNFSYFIDPQVPALVSGDPKRLKQILLNLINNSIKFTDAGFVKLSVGIEGEASGRSQFKFIVEDSGIGISENDQAKIFNAFTQLDPSSTRNKGGVGLGLSIVKTILTKIGGSIQIESKVELGTRFVVTIPYEVMDEGSWVGKAVEPYVDFFRGKSISILSTEDFEHRMMMSVFEKLDCPIEFFSSEFRFVKNFNKTQSFNEIYIIDCEAIQNDRKQFFEEIRKISHPKISILFLLPVMHQKQDFEEIQKIPNIKIVYKPISFNTMLATLSNQILPLGTKVDPDEEPFDKDSKLLIVEDDYENRQLLKAYLADVKFEVFYAASGNEALQLYKKHHPHLIVTDIQMPEMDGFRLTSLIRDYEKEYKITPSIIFALSADALPEHKTTAQEAGVNKYLTKPISKSVFIGSLGEAERLYKKHVEGTFKTVKKVSEHNH